MLLFSHISVITLKQLARQKPDALLVLPWNLIDELRQQLPGMELVTAIPSLSRDSGAMMGQSDHAQ